MPTPSAASGEIRSLTGLRGVAAMFVVFYHALHLSSPLAGFLLGKGYLSVDLFFVLSGYVLSLNYAEQFLHSATPLRTYGKFLGLRFARIYPLYIVAVLAAVVLAHFGAIPLYGVSNLKGAVAWNITLMQAWSFGVGNIDGAAWSISTEWTAYLLFPALVFIVFGGSSRRAWLVAALAYVVVAGLCILSLRQFPGAPATEPLNWFDTATPVPVLRCLAGFMLGMAVYRLQTGRFARALASRPLTGDVLAIMVVGLCFFQQGDMLFVVVAALLVAHLALSHSVTSTILSTRPIHYLGVISYSIYLVHLLMIYVLRGVFDAHGWPTVAASWLAIALTLAVSPLVYHTIEVPGRQAIRRLLSVRKAPAAAVQ